MGADLNLACKTLVALTVACLTACGGSDGGGGDSEPLPMVAASPAVILLGANRLSPDSGETTVSGLDADQLPPDVSAALAADSLPPT